MHMGQERRVNGLTGRVTIRGPPRNKAREGEAALIVRVWLITEKGGLGEVM
jgi:hypothetical protein